MNLKLILKGFIVGLGKIIPGVSGSMLAVSLGIYENLLESITNFFGNPKSNFKLLANFGLGVFFSIILFSKLLLFLLNNYYAPTMYLFLGLIVGTLISFTKEIKWNLKNILLFLLFFSLSFILSIKTTCIQLVFKGGFLNYLYTCFLGLIDAFTSIVPGISGTAIFMLLGVYEYVLSILSNPFNLLFVIYGSGMILGIIIICYIMNYLLKNYKQTTYAIIFAFMLSSIITIFLNISAYFNLSLLIVFLLGSFFGFILDK